ncbi:DUF4179 domain-containing protein [Robertmurraya andreesenii]|uniref:DUF4179 domain-containing protein n=1 Tax=Anoxybacillus andreesenii TaxID=1325932 RepID=A0ABT9V4G2_9BACL|nr:DUF4179 domain-containing protein [Robertmurraya andreesenii]MDQ0155745.1 hypothetical protein [Robertmurraya andreesenii]
MILPAAVVVLAFGLTASLSPSFADWIGGLFATEQVDEGLRMASDAGFAERVDLEVTDQKLTFKVEDVVADTSRIAFSYQVLNQNGKPQKVYLDFADSNNEIYALDPERKRLEISSMGWSGTEDDYGLIELSIRDQTGIEDLIIKIQLTKINGVKGNWELEIPVDLKKSLQSTKTIALNDVQTSAHGVTVNMKEVRFAPSSNEIIYETGFTDKEKQGIEEQTKQLEKAFGKSNVHSFGHYGTAIQYHLENQDSKPIYYHNAFLEGKGHTSDLGLIQGTGEDGEQFGQMKWNESFIPQKADAKLTFVLDGVIKTVPSDFSIKIKPKDLKKKPLTFEYEGNYLTIKDVNIESDYSLRKSVIPIEKDSFLKIEMEGGKEAKSSDLGAWIMVDDQGQSYEAFHSGSILDEKDKNGRYKTTTELRIYNLEEIPEELTLHLISVTRYHEVKEKWRVPLY